MKRGEVHLLRGHEANGAAVTYGRGLDGLVVLEYPSSGKHAKAPQAPGSNGELSLPTVSLGSVSGQELQTPLGTVIRFQPPRRGVHGRRLGEARGRRAGRSRPIAVNDANGGGGAAPIEVRGLTKRYGEIIAVDGVDLTIEPGDVFGYLGPNGAGKTTSLRMMLGLIRPSAGSVRLFGRDPQISVKALEGVAGFVEAPVLLSVLQRPPEPRALRGARRARRRSRQGDRRGPGDRRPPGSGQGQGARLLPRDAPAARHRVRAPAPPAPADPGRADHGPRPRGDARHAPARTRSRRARDNRPAVEPSPGRGRRAVQPGGDHPPGPDRLRGVACRAQADGGPQLQGAHHR